MKKSWLEFTVIEDTGKTKKWSVTNKSTRVFVGQVKWYGGWRRYAFFTDADMLFDADCLREIADFLEQQMNDRKI